MTQSVAFIRVAGTTAEMVLAAKRTEELLRYLIKVNGGLAMKLNELNFPLNLANYLTSTHRSEMQEPNRRHNEFIKLAVDMIAASERKYGGDPDVNVVYEKAYIQKEQAFSHLDEREWEEAIACWKKFMELEKLYWVRVDERGNGTEAPIGLSLEHADGFIKSIAQSDEQAQEMAQRANYLPGKALFRSYHDAREDSLELIEALIENIKTGANKDSAARVIAAFVNLDYDNIKQTANSQGVSGLDKDKQGALRQDIVSVAHRSQRPRVEMFQIEAATDSGDWATVAKHHESLMAQAIGKLDYDEALEHADILISIYERDPIFESSLKDIRKRRQGLVAIKGYMETTVAPKEEPNRPIGNDTLESLDNVTKTLKGGRAGVNYLDTLNLAREIFKIALNGWKMTEKTNKEFLQPLLRQLMRRADDPSTSSDSSIANTAS